MLRDLPIIRVHLPPKELVGVAPSVGTHMII